MYVHVCLVILQVSLVVSVWYNKSWTPSCMQLREHWSRYRATTLPPRRRKRATLLTRRLVSGKQLYEMYVSSPLTSLSSAHKSVMTGPKSQTIHKEELGVSNAERQVRRRVEENARVQQRKRSAMADRQGDGGSKVKSSGKRSPVSPVSQ